MPKTRAHFLDRLRVFLTILVIFHHCAITYGGSGNWFYREASFDPAVGSSFFLTMLCSIDQAFFMGMFFLIAGYFTPSAFEHKGAKAYLRERLVRLIVPLKFFGLLLGPVTVAIASTAKGGDLWTNLSRQYEHFRIVLGPLWFTWALMLFSIAYAGWRSFGGKHNSGVKPVPSSLHWLLAGLLVGSGALLIRQWIPTGSNVLGLQLGYFSSYIFLFVIGCASSRSRWLERINRNQALVWFAITLVAIPLLPIAAASAGAFQGKPVDFSGGWSLPSAAYSYWEPFVAWGVIAFLLWLFRTRFNKPNERWEKWSQAAYAAFVVHAPVLVGISVLFSDWSAPPLVKFLSIGSMATIASFTTGRGLLMLPGVKRVLG